VQETVDGHSDSSLETESFLRATESVVTAMQARMSFSLDSGGESDVDTSHSYQAPPGSTTGGGGTYQNLLYLVLMLCCGLCHQAWFLTILASACLAVVKRGICILSGNTQREGFPFCP
jgi:hypothetical protein